MSTKINLYVLAPFTRIAQMDGGEDTFVQIYSSSSGKDPEPFKCIHCGLDHCFGWKHLDNDGIFLSKHCVDVKVM